MTKNKLFNPWTWGLSFPAPFNKLANKNSTSFYSEFNSTLNKKSVLHSPTLYGLLAYLKIINHSEEYGAIGTNKNKIIVEYKDSYGINLIVYDRKNGNFIVDIFDYDYTNSFKHLNNYELGEGRKSGVALFIPIIHTALEEPEFEKQFNIFKDCEANNFINQDETFSSAFILCDNIYRRIENCDNVKNYGIKCNIPLTQGIPSFDENKLKSNFYSPSCVLYGKFKIVTPIKPTNSNISTISHSEFAGKYKISERIFTDKEKELIPKLKSSYIIPKQVPFICNHIQKSTEFQIPMRNFLLRGGSGTGKTKSSEAIAAGIGLPYLKITCNPNMDFDSLTCQYAPDNEEKEYKHQSFPSLIDIKLDVPSAYYKLTGKYIKEITESEVYQELIKAAIEHGKKLSNQQQKIRMIESNLVKALRYGYVIEIQEISVITNPAVLVGFNDILENGSLTLPNGEEVKRHPDTIMIFTTNNDYYGCKPLNQSVVSRMSLILDYDKLDKETCISRALGITKCPERKIVERMVDVFLHIQEKCQENSITDSCCDMRKLISWIQSYMLCKNILEAAEYTIIPSVSNDCEIQEEIRNTCLLPIFKK